MDTPTLSLYLHIPFCTTKCSYCAFNTYTNMEHLIDGFVDAIMTEIRIVAISAKDRSTIGTIYFGGGTPSLLTSRQIIGILSTIRSHFDVVPDVEISLEANPDDLSSEYLENLVDVGISRLSIGMQSAITKELIVFDRRHSAEAVVDAVENARLAGFSNINLDLIYGAPLQTLNSWHLSLQQLLSLYPEHISVYALGLEEGTPLAVWIGNGFLPSSDDDLVADMYDMASEMLGATGYEQYEISNWSKPGFACRHNIQYWRNRDYVGLGPGAHGFAGGYRYSNLLSPLKYVQLLKPNLEIVYVFPRTPVIAQFAIVDRHEEIIDTLIMNLRLTQLGINRQEFVHRFGEDVMDICGEVLHHHASCGLVEIDDSHVRITEKGRLLSNRIFREFV